MKLTEKGFQEVRKICWESSHNCLKIAENLNQFDFKQEHFKDCVMLTVEEACEILDYLSFLKWRHFNDEFLYGLADCNKRLNKRIEQAEK